MDRYHTYIIEFFCQCIHYCKENINRKYTEHQYKDNTEIYKSHLVGSNYIFNKDINSNSSSIYKHK